MPARLNLRHQQMVRDKIQASVLIQRLEAHAMGEVDMTPTQVRSAEVLLKKIVPDLSAVQVDGDGEGGPIKHALEVRFVEPG
jgi:hypothetical protein